MGFLTFLADYFTHLDWRDPTVLGVAAIMALMAYFKRWFLIVMTLGTMVAAKGIQYFFPEATGPFVADLTLVQVVYILGGVVIAITALGQMALRH
ncbi:MAG TPA: hypothetical protein VMS93_12865 [Candidatus Saccharimonadales bacterium]|nr:hypothetical protein [Candidatus Saccharimonadales bacterium]